MIADLAFLSNYIVPIIIGICLCVGFVLKELIASNVINKYIPLVMAILGLIINIWINKTITPDIALGGMVSGLASTGLYEMFKNLIEKKD